MRSYAQRTFACLTIANADKRRLHVTHTRAVAVAAVAVVAAVAAIDAIDSRAIGTSNGERALHHANNKAEYRLNGAARTLCVQVISRCTASFNGPLITRNIKL